MKTSSPKQRKNKPSQSNLATVLQELGEFKESKALLSKVLHSVKSNFEPSINIEMMENNLTNLLHQIEIFEQSKELLRKALPVAEKRDDIDSLEIDIVHSNLDVVFEYLYRFGEWKTIPESFQVIIDDYEPEHPCIAIAQSNGEAVVKSVSCLEDAKNLLIKALILDEKSSAPHGTLAAIQSNLGMEFWKEGNVEKAKAFLIKALQSAKEVYSLGNHHLTSIQANLNEVLSEIENDSNLAQVLEEMNML